MKKTVYKAAVFLLIAATLLSFSGCGESGKIKALIADFQTACNNVDLNAAAECIDNPIFNAIKGVSGIAGDLLGLEEGKLAELVGDLLGDLGDLTTGDYLKTMQIKVTKVKVDGTTAQATAQLSGSGFGDSSYATTVIFECAQVGDAWKIKNIKGAE